jgi:hypothetical protein
MMNSPELIVVVWQICGSNPGWSHSRVLGMTWDSVQAISLLIVHKPKGLGLDQCVWKVSNTTFIPCIIFNTFLNLATSYLSAHISIGNLMSLLQLKKKIATIWINVVKIKTV